MNIFQAYLLVNDDKSFIVIWTDFVFQCNDLLHAILNELPLCRHKLLPLLGTLVEKARVDLSLFILQRDVAGQHIGVLHPFLHVWVSGTVIQHQTSDQSEIEKVGIGANLNPLGLIHTPRPLLSKYILPYLKYSVSF